MSVGRPIGPTLEELRSRLLAELRRHPPVTRGAVVMRSDLTTALDVDAEAVEQLIAQTVSAGHLAAATWLVPTDGDDAALVALLAPADAR